MSSKTLTRRAYEKARREVLNLAGRDSVTLQKVSRHPNIRRIGTVYGGWMIPQDALNANSVCYCAGCGEDISFDLGLIERYGCEVYAFDPTPRAVAYVRKVAGDNRAYHFTEVGLWSHEDVLKFFAPENPSHVSHSLLNLQRTADHIEVKVKRLKQLMRDNGHDRLDLLKLDIEGAEYAVLDSIFEDRIPIQMLCVEFDEYWHPQDAGCLNRIKRYIHELGARGYKMINASRSANYTFILGQ